MKLFVKGTIGLVSLILGTLLVQHPSTAEPVDDLYIAAVKAFKSNQQNEALQFIQQAIDLDPNNPRLFNTAGVILKILGDFDRAADHFSTALKFDPNSFNSNYNAANLVHYEIFDKKPNNIEFLDRSLQYYQHAIEAVFQSNLTDTGVSMQEKINVLNDASIALKKRSRNQEAIELLKKVVELDPNNSQGLGNLALAYMDAGNVESALEVSEVAIGHDPNNEKLRTNHAVMLETGNKLSQLDANEVVFGMIFEHKSPKNGTIVNVKIQLKRNDNAIALVNQLTSKIELDLLTYRWLHCTFNHALARLKENIVMRPTMTIDGKDLPPVIVRFGDDLYSLSRSYAFLNGLNDDVSKVIYQNLVAKVPQHSEINWVNARKRQLYIFDSKNRGRQDDYLSISRKQYGANGQCKLTLAIVSSGKLDFFYNLVQKLPTSVPICEVIVLDYLLSSADRQKIIKDFPQFTFVLASEQDSSQAKAINKLIRQVKTTHLLLLNDSWEPMDNAGDNIMKSLTLMDSASKLGMPIAQVLMNEQSSTSCSLGINLNDCRNSDFYGKSGWERTLKTDSSSFSFLEHEFGIHYLDHKASSTWPGFTINNPALWNLDLVTSSVKSVVNEDREDFEALFALDVLENGLTTVHLPDVCFRYIGY
jgi:Flp pilus assembly protein TadD